MPKGCSCCDCGVPAYWFTPVQKSLRNSAPGCVDAPGGFALGSPAEFMMDFGSQLDVLIDPAKICHVDENER